MRSVNFGLSLPHVIPLSPWACYWIIRWCGCLIRRTNIEKWYLLFSQCFFPWKAISDKKWDWREELRPDRGGFHCVARSFYFVSKWLQIVCLDLKVSADYPLLQELSRGKRVSVLDPGPQTTLLLKNMRSHWRVLSENWTDQILSLQTLLCVGNRFGGIKFMINKSTSRRQWLVNVDKRGKFTNY